ncbi:MAG: hypothetical protein OXH41_13000 [Chloroflexi bacterium]|nr:hypothetical protein [Chloroflexota bacterium]
MSAGGAQIALVDLHEETANAHDLFRNGHLQDAVRRASQRFLNRVAEQAGHPVSKDKQGKDTALQGTSLVNRTFSEDNPILVLNSHESLEDWTLVDRDEHNGYRFLGVGLVQVIRNVFTHADDYGLTETEALEWLAFISAMHRRLDGAQQFVPPPEAEPDSDE